MVEPILGSCPHKASLVMRGQLMNVRMSECGHPPQELQRVMEPLARAATALPPAAFRADPFVALTAFGRYLPQLLQARSSVVACVIPVLRSVGWQGTRQQHAALHAACTTPCLYRLKPCPCEMTSQADIQSIVLTGRSACVFFLRALASTVTQQQLPDEDRRNEDACMHTGRRQPCQAGGALQQRPRWRRQGSLCEELAGPAVLPPLG